MTEALWTPAAATAAAAAAGVVGGGVMESDRDPEGPGITAVMMVKY